MSQGVESEAGEPGGKREYGTNRQPANRDTPIPAEPDLQDSVKQAGGSLETSRTDGHHQPQTLPSDKMHTSITWYNRTYRSIYMHVTESVCNHCSRFENIRILT